MVIQISINLAMAGFDLSAPLFQRKPAEGKTGAKFQSASAGTRMADVDQRFFCHQCSVEIPRFVHGASMSFMLTCVIKKIA